MSKYLLELFILLACASSNSSCFQVLLRQPAEFLKLLLQQTHTFPVQEPEWYTFRRYLLPMQTETQTINYN